ncbi:MAG: YHYH domain-containing protein [Lachnospiraceae bacterium]|nr:YHYH domain-containing protein [Lachnospiraceae bacterium]
MERRKKNVLKRLFTGVLCAFILMATLPTNTWSATVLQVEAHSGRTDASGGHHDYKNKSGLGSYHYHCGGHPAHLHTNGVCPYASATATQSTTSESVTAAAIVQPAAATTAASAATTIASAGTVYNGVDYAPVFNAVTYYTANPDLQSVVGSDAVALFAHYLTSGIAEGRVASEEFSIAAYKANNPDLVSAYGDNNSAYVTHYLTAGKAEGRIAK